MRNIHNAYAVKIDDDYKIIQNCNTSKSQLEKIIKSYYTNLTIEIFELKINTPDLLNQMIELNSFFKVNITDIEEFQLRLKQYDDITEYFNKYLDYKISDSSSKTESTRQICKTESKRQMCKNSQRLA